MSKPDTRRMGPPPAGNDSAGRDRRQGRRNAGCSGVVGDWLESESHRPDTVALRCRAAESGRPRAPLPRTHAVTDTVVCLPRLDVRSRLRSPPCPPSICRPTPPSATPCPCARAARCRRLPNAGKACRVGSLHCISAVWSASGLLLPDGMDGSYIHLNTHLAACQPFPIDISEIHSHGTKREAALCGESAASGAARAPNRLCLLRPSPARRTTLLARHTARRARPSR